MQQNAQVDEKRRFELLADFRHHLRLFLQFSEQAALRCGLHPQQHQLLLQLAGAPDGVQTSVSYARERLGLRHNTVVELSKRSEAAGLITREHETEDARIVVLKLTRKGRALLDALSEDHARELHELAPQLIPVLAQLSAASATPGRHGSKR